MIPILYESNEVAFTNNGLCRLTDMISCIVSEERNGVYECNFEYPVSGANYDMIQCGRIIAVTHDDSQDIQPFDIVGYEKPISGVVTFHAVHISYRQCRLTVKGSNINSLSAAFTALGNAVPSNPFTYTSDKSSTGYVGAFDGLPQTVRSILGGMEGSLLDAYGGEYEWDKFNVILHSARGQYRDFSIRYGINMVDYNDEADFEGVYSSCVPYWTDGENTIIGDRVVSGQQTNTGRGECLPLDVSEKFETQPTKAQVEAAGLAYMTSNTTYLPSQNIEIEFLHLQDVGEFDKFSNLRHCKLCDSINVIFPDYNTSAYFKIVRTDWNVLTDRYDSMELGDLSVSLAEAIGVDSSSSHSPSGGGGTTNYNDLSNKPSINSVTLSGNKTTSDLSIHDLPSGGTSGQVLAKNSGTNYDVGWITPSGGGGVDYIVDQGTSDGWLYRKWNSGKIELWANDTKTVSCTSAFASTGAYYSGAQTYNLPSSLGINSITHFYGSGAPGNQGWIMIVSASTTSLSWRAYNRTSNASCSVLLNFYVVGTYS